MTAKCAPIKDAVFLSARDSMCFYDVRRDGTVTLFDEYSDGRGETPELLHLAPAESWHWQDGYLPILHSGNDTLFAFGDELLVKSGDGCFAYPGKRPLTQEEFANVAEQLSAFWNGWLKEGLVLPSVNAEIDCAWRSSLIQARCAFVGRHPSYGMLRYRRMAHDSFPPAMLSMCETLLQYGHQQEAIDIFAYYFKRFVRADGSIDYYGASVAEYGALLRLGAQLMKAVPQSALDLSKIILPMIKQVLDMFDREDHIRATEDTGLIAGSPEADERQKVAIYYHNNYQLLRGLLELAPQMAAVGEPEFSCELRKHSAFLARSLRRSFETRKASIGGIPYATNQTELVHDIQSDRNAIYANYRYHLETLETGLLPREDALAIIEYRENHNGEYCGMTRFTGRDGRRAVDNWPIASYARGLLEYGEKERFMRLLEAQLKNYMSPDVFTAYEQETIEGNSRHAFAPFCVPVQLAFPRMLAWSFCYTKWDGETISWGGPDWQD